METHSLGAAVLAGLAVATVTRGRAGGWRGGGARLGVARGLRLAGFRRLPAAWRDGAVADVDAFYFADAFVFEAISRRYWLPGFWRHNLLAVVREVAILLPLAGAAWWLRRRHRPGA